MGVRERFITETLETEGRKMLQSQQRAMQSSLKFHTGRTLSSRHISVSSDGEASGTLTFRHSIQERFLDLRKLRHGSVQSHRPKLRQIHNRFVFGAFASISRRLMYGLTEDVIERLRGETK